MNDEEIFDNNPLDASNGDNSEGDSVNEAPSESSNFDDKLRLCQTISFADVSQAMKAELHESDTFCKIFNAVTNNMKDK